jgi:site-specific DNA-cytosine methylase
VFIVASLGDDCGQKVLFESDSLPGDIEKSGQQKQEDSGKTVSGSEAKSGLLAESGVVSSLTKSFGGAGVDAQHAQNGWLISVENVLFSENQKQAAYSITPKTGGGNELRAQEINQANSLTAIGQHHDRGTKVVEDLGVRKITPTECERLMGFPDNWTLLDDQGKIIKDTPRYKMCGNAVVVNVAKWLGERIVSVSK